MPTPSQGQIVTANVLDPQNRNPKVRPVVIITPTDEIICGQQFVGVAITSTLPKKLPANMVRLPFHPLGKTRTGLKKGSAANCQWLVKLRHEDIVDYIGVAPEAALAAITKCVDSLP